MSILLFILFGSITLSFWSVCIASGRADKNFQRKDFKGHFLKRKNY